MKKSYNKILIVISFTFLLIDKIYAQSYTELSNIKVGETAPDIMFSNIEKYEKSEKKLSEFSEKLIIIDFWATWCAPCLKMLPTMDSLMESFNGDLLFISTTKEPKSYAKPFLEKYEANQGIKFKVPVIYGDNELKKLFPHRLLPHYVWLNPGTKKVIAITRAEEVTKSNIQNYIQNQGTSQLSVKLDRWLNYKDSESLLAYLAKMDNSKLNGVPNQYSSFWGYIPDLRGVQYSHLGDSINNNRILLKNESRSRIIRFAFGEGRKFFQERSVIIDTKDKNLFTTELSNAPFRDWLRKNAVTYEISVLPQNRHKIFDMMRNDLINYFSSYDIRIEKRNTNCLVLISTGSNEALRNKGGKWQIIKDRFGYHATNSILEDFIVDLSLYYLQDGPVIVNEVKSVDFNIDLDLNVSNFKDIVQLNRELAKYNLKFVEKEALGEFLVISDKIRTAK